MDQFPVIEVAIKGFTHVIQCAIDKHLAELSQEVSKSLEKLCQPEALQKSVFRQVEMAWERELGIILSDIIRNSVQDKTFIDRLKQLLVEKMSEIHNESHSDR